MFADAGSLFGAGAGAKNAPQGCEAADDDNGGSSVCLADSSAIRSSVGCRASMWTFAASARSACDFAKALTKEPYDETQMLPLRRGDEVLTYPARVLKGASGSAQSSAEGIRIGNRERRRAADGFR